MEELLMYPDKVADKSISVISERIERYTGLLDKAIENFNRQLEGIEKRCSDTAENPDELKGETVKVMNDMVSICEKFEQGVDYDKSIIEAAQVKFREKTDQILSKSYCINRARTWPQGYQGDYMTLETIYRNTPLSEGIGYYLDRYALSSTLAVAVRERIVKLQEILREELIKRESPKVLDIACGSCREIHGLVTEIRRSEARFTCVDLDSDALNFAMNRLSYTDLLPEHTQFFKYNALRMFDHELNMEEFGMQDIIYSVGYFDYLPDDFLVKLLNALYMLLKPGGKLIAAFKDTERYRYQDFHWIVNWDGFLQRNEDEFDRLFKKAKIPESALSKTRERTGVIIFYTMEKNNLIPDEGWQTQD
jgi:SAM-dependent methyltransferase